MISWRKIYEFFTIFIYLILLLIILNYQENNSGDKICTEEHKCIQFCSERESFINFSRVFIEKEEERIIELNDDGLIVTRDKWEYSKILNRSFTIFRSDLECIHEAIEPTKRNDRIWFEFNSVKY